MSSHGIQIVATLGVVILGTGVLGNVRYLLRDYRRTYRLYSMLRDPDEVRGEVVETDVEERNVAPKFSRPRMRYVPKVTFEYSYEGQRRESSDVRPLSYPHESEMAEAQKTVVQYEPGDNVRAYVDPDRPDDAFLKADDGGYWMYPILRTLTTLIGVGMLWIVITQALLG